MRNPEHQSIINKTIGSEAFVSAARKPIALVLFVGGVLLGPGAIIHAIDLIEQDKIHEGVWYATAGIGEVTGAAAIAFANLKSIAKPRSFENPQSPKQSNRK